MTKNTKTKCFRPPFPLIGFRAHHSPLFPSLPLAFPPHRPFPHPPLAASCTTVAANDLVGGNKPTNERALLPPAVVSRPTSLFSVLNGAGASGAVVPPVSGSGLVNRMEETSISSSICHNYSSITDMTLKHDTTDTNDDPGDNFANISHQVLFSISFPSKM